MTAQSTYVNLTASEVYTFPSSRIMEVRDNVNNVERLVTFRVDRIVAYYVDLPESELTLIVEGLPPLKLRFDSDDDEWGYGQVMVDLIDELNDLMQGKEKQ